MQRPNITGRPAVVAVAFLAAFAACVVAQAIA